MVEEAKCAGELGKLTVGYHNVGLESALRGAHTGEVDAISRAPVFALQISEVTRHHRDVDAPVFKAYEHAHAYFVHSGLSHAVVTVETPLVVRLHAFGVIYLVALAVVRFLKTHYAVEAAFGEPAVFLHFERLHLDGEVVKIRPAGAQHLLEIFHTATSRSFSAHYQQILKRTETLDGFTFVFDLLHSEHSSGKRIVVVESAIDAKIGAEVCDVHGNVHRYCLAETLLCEVTRELRHLFKKRSGCRRYQGHEIVIVEQLGVAACLVEHAPHIVGGFRAYGLACARPGIPVDNVGEAMAPE